MGLWGGVVQLTPPSHGVFATRHDVFALLVLARDHLKLDAGVAHPMVSTGTRAMGLRLYDFTMMGVYCECLTGYGFTMTPVYHDIDLLHHSKSRGFPGDISDPYHASYLLRHSCRI